MMQSANVFEGSILPGYELPDNLQSVSFASNQLSGEGCRWMRPETYRAQGLCAPPDIKGFCF